MNTVTSIGTHPWRRRWIVEDEIRRGLPNGVLTLAAGFDWMGEPSRCRAPHATELFASYRAQVFSRAARNLSGAQRLAASTRPVSVGQRSLLCFRGRGPRPALSARLLCKLTWRKVWVLPIKWILTCDHPRSNLFNCIQRVVVGADVNCAFIADRGGGEEDHAACGKGPFLATVRVDRIQLVVSRADDDRAVRTNCR
jgi:hypothetical protein